MTEEDPANEGRNFMISVTGVILLAIGLAICAALIGGFFLVRWIGLSVFTDIVFWIVFLGGAGGLINWLRHT